MDFGLIDLLKPHFLAGFDLPESIHNIIAFLRVNELQTSWDKCGVVYSGKASFVGEGNASPVPKYRSPSGSFWEWEDVNIRFRLTVPRRGSDQIKNAVKGIDSLKTALEKLESTDNGSPSDYPGFEWQCEMMVSAVTLHLPTWEILPARLIDGWIEHDSSFPDVKISLPKISFVVSQGKNYGDVSLNFKGWGMNSLDDPADPEAGELFRMTPPVAMHSSGVFGFGIEKAVLDMSENFTPPEILGLFGIGDDFKGLWLPQLRFFFTTGVASGLTYDLKAKDLLIDVKGEVSGEFAVEVIKKNSKLNVEPIFTQNKTDLKLTKGNEIYGDRKTIITKRHIKLTTEAILQLRIFGGMPPYSVDLQLKSGNTVISGPSAISKNKSTYWSFKDITKGFYSFSIKVSDNSSPNKYLYEEIIDLEVTSEQGLLEKPGISELNIHVPIPDGYSVKKHDDQPDKNAIFIKVFPETKYTCSLEEAGVTPSIYSSGLIKIPLCPLPVNGEIKWTNPEIEPYIAFFDFEKPKENDPGIYKQKFLNDPLLKTFLEQVKSANVEISLEGNASFEGKPEAENNNSALSGRRLQQLVDVILETDKSIKIASKTIYGTKRANPSYPDTPSFENDTKFRNHPYLSIGCKYGENGYFPNCYWTAIAYVSGPVNKTAEIAFTLSTSNDSTNNGKPPSAEPQPIAPVPAPPSIFRSIGIRVRLQRNVFVLAEIKGQLDFQTSAENLARQITTDPANIQVTSSNGAATQPQNQPPAQGILDYRLTITYDNSAKKLTQQLVLGFDKENKNGWIFWEPKNPSAFSSFFGSLAAFAPLIAISAESVITSQGKNVYSDIALTTGVLAISWLSTTQALKLKKFIFYGAELIATETLPGYMQLKGAEFDQLSVLIDYAVDFDVDIKIGDIQIKNEKDPIRVRYRAIGFRMAKESDGKWKFQPIFDPSKGFQFELADPKIFNLGNTLGKIFKVLGARVSRLNPIMLEFDIGMKINLGLFTVDSFRVTVPIDDPNRAPTILPTGISVNIPKALVGKGVLDIRDGFKGQLDLTLVPLKLRIAAAVGIQNLQQGSRSLTAVYLKLVVEFPKAIPIAGTGLGLYGILGLFAMHFKRNETNNPNINIPALNWLNTTPVEGDPTEMKGWIAAADQWAFGVGVVLGSMEGGLLINLKGMLMLELPGPRILIFVNAKVLEKDKANTKGKVEGGMLAVVDLDFARQRLTIGVIADYSIKNIISIKVPAEAFFGLNDISNWHLYIGDFKTRVKAEVLGLVKAEGYLMLAGHDIKDFPFKDSTITLQGFAVALGIKAAVILGKKESGIYLEVSASMNVAMSFNPVKLYGTVELRGELHLIIVSISAWASLTVEAPEPTCLHGTACGEVKLLFFSIKGCVTITIGNPAEKFDVPPLIRGMILQSRSPALVEGSGSDRLIDGSLGEAHAEGLIPDVPKLVVPIDSIPIFNLYASPALADCFQSFTDGPHGTSARFLAPDGWNPVSDQVSVRYELVSIDINPKVNDKPPAIWRALSNRASGNDTSVDLALMSWDPEHFSRAIVQSTELTERVKQRWGNLCQKVAPPCFIMWNFCEKPLGYSSVGWTLTGTRWPDPPGSFRSTNPKDNIRILEAPGDHKSPLIDHLIKKYSGIHLDHAKIIGGEVVNPEMITAVAFNESVRVLELPHEYETLPDTEMDIPTEYKNYTPKENQKIIIECGNVNNIRLLVALNLPHGNETQDLIDLFNEINRIDWVVLRGIDKTGKMTEEVMMKDVLEIILPSGIQDYPERWSNPEGPWYRHVSKVHEYLKKIQNRLVKCILNWNPDKEIVKFEIIVKKTRINRTPSLLLCLIEMGCRDEILREQQDIMRRDTDIQNAINGLKGGVPRQLLEPGQKYTISMTYKAKIRKTIENNKFEFSNYTENENENITRNFTFLTDDKPPLRLNPWILLTTPEPEEQFFFRNDAIRLLFCDASAIQLWQAYKKTLRVVIRNANGNHPKNQPEITEKKLKKIPAKIYTPFQDTLRNVISELDLKCIGSAESESHRKFICNIPLEKQTSYTLEIEEDPSENSETVRLPLFKIAFRTSRYDGANELAEIIRYSYIDERALNKSLKVLADSASDAEIQKALLDSGLDAMSPSGEPKMVMLWEPDSVINKGNGYYLRAILIDSPEPLWRYRDEPVKELINPESGPMERYVMKKQCYLELAESEQSASTVVERFVKSPGGTRTLIMLLKGATEINVELKQKDILLEGGKISTYTILNSKLSQKPSWVMNEITD